jgi:hypothetical protein
VSAPDPNGTPGILGTDVHRDHYGVGLLLILTTIISLSLSGVSRWAGPFVVAVVGLTVVVLLRASAVRPARLRLATGAAGAAVLMSVLATASSDRLDWVSPAITAILVLVVPAAIVGRLRSSERVDAGMVYGALCIYLLAGFFFASIYSLIDRVGGEPFFAQAGARDPVDFVYFSFITLSTVGYGDLTARGDLGRMLAVSETLLGQLYLVAVVATLVGNLGQSRANRSDGG